MGFFYNIIRKLYLRNWLEMKKIFMISLLILLVTGCSSKKELNCTIKNNGGEYLNEEINSTLYFTRNGSKLKKSHQETIISGQYIKNIGAEEYAKEQCKKLEEVGAKCSYKVLSEDKVKYIHEKEVDSSDLKEALNFNYGVDEFNYDSLKEAINNKDNSVCE